VSHPSWVGQLYFGLDEKTINLPLLADLTVRRSSTISEMSAHTQLIVEADQPTPTVMHAHAAIAKRLKNWSGSHNRLAHRYAIAGK